MIKIKFKISKSQWQEAGKKAGWIKTSQGRMGRNEEEMYSTTGKPMDADTIIQTDHIARMQKMLHAIDLAIPCLEDWIRQTGFGETNQRDKKSSKCIKGINQRR